MPVLSGFTGSVVVCACFVVVVSVVLLYKAVSLGSVVVVSVVVSGTASVCVSVCVVVCVSACVILMIAFDVGCIAACLLIDISVWIAAVTAGFLSAVLLTISPPQLAIQSAIHILIMAAIIFFILISPWFSIFLSSTYIFAVTLGFHSIILKKFFIQ